MAEHEIDPVTRAALFIRMNDLVVNHVAVIPMVTRAGTFAITKTLQGVDFSPYNGPLWQLMYWYRGA
jgi:peptide/nickel transport system substrate-binding protein